MTENHFLEWAGLCFTFVSGLVSFIVGYAKVSGKVEDLVVRFNELRNDVIDLYKRSESLSGKSAAQDQININLIAQGNRIEKKLEDIENLLRGNHNAG